jgi:4-alpha-glucanotransferase
MPMSDDALRELAEAAGISTRWFDYRGEYRTVAPETLRALLTTLGINSANSGEIAASLAALAQEQASTKLPPMRVAVINAPVAIGPIAAWEPGRAYRIHLEGGGVEDGRLIDDGAGRACLAPVAVPGYHVVELDGQLFVLAATPPRCYGVADVVGKRRVWGLTAQLYSLRRSGDGGIGDFSGLAEFAASAARHGADALAVSPAHALFSADLARFSPYSPSSRLFLNAQHVDPAATFGRAQVQAAIAAAGLGEQWAALEALPLIDWPTAAAAKLDVLHRLYKALPSLPESMQDDFTRYQAEAGPALRDHARFEALHAHFLSGPEPRWNWRDWPAAYQDCTSPEVAAFADANADTVRFHVFLQWLADRGLRDAHAAAKQSGMAIGLIGDLAVGTDGGGSHGWSRRHDLLIGAGVGAPPDALNALGQNWGLTTFSPRALQQQAYAPFIEMLRAQLRHVGGLRIDHVIGLGRLWLVPDGAGETGGAYLRYPIDDLFGLLALESWRHRAVIVGEDMGTVPEGFRERMAAVGILGMRVLWFERDWGLFVAPDRWPSGAVALTTTHDLATVAGWWQGRDIDWRAKLALYGEGQDETADRAARAEDRTRLWAAFDYAGVASGPQPADDAPAAVVDAAAAFIGKTPAPLALLPVEDALGVVEQPNVPGTIDSHPNWRRRLPGNAGASLDEPAVQARLAQLARLRPRTSNS